MPCQQHSESVVFLRALSRDCFGAFKRCVWRRKVVKSDQETFRIVGNGHCRSAVTVRWWFQLPSSSRRRNIFALQARWCVCVWLSLAAKSRPGESTPSGSRVFRPTQRRQHHNNNKREARRNASASRALRGAVSAVRPVSRLCKRQVFYFNFEF